LAGRKGILKLSRGRYPRRINLGAVDPVLLGRYLQIWDGALLHREPENFPLMSAQPLFGKNLPISLDIGCGTGEFLCSLADRVSNQLFIGLDSARKPVIRAALRAAELGLENILFIRTDVRQAYSRMLSRTFRAIYLQYPVPGAGSRRRRPEIFDDRFLFEVARVLKIGGRLSVLTDQKSAYHSMLRTASSISEFRPLKEDEFELEFNEDLKSHNFRIWSSRGHQPLRFEVEKIANPVATMA
jgi:tRNA (guanine-N7-)-methyltransferase